MHRQSIRIPRVCQHCLAPFDAQPSEVRRGGALFCSRACSTAAHAGVLPERFWSKVDKHSGLFWNGTECWLWRAGVNKEGYGIFWADGESQRAHRYAYQLAHGPIPAGALVCHHCDRPGCVRDEHHFLDASAGNSRDAAAKGRMASGARNGARLYPERLVRGEHAHNAVPLDAAQLAAIRSRHALGESTQPALAREYGVAQSTISRIIRKEGRFAI
jgi:hypothetical protein